MKKMTLRARLTLLNALVFVVVAAAVAYVWSGAWWMLALLLALVAAWVVLAHLLWRCPHCGGRLRPLRPMAHCPNCGEKLDFGR